MSKFTPGPWTVEDPMGCELSIVEANKEAYEWKFIASLTLPEKSDPDEPEEDKDFPLGVVWANARLIAAAPELLEALKAMVEIADRRTFVFDRARAAIAKAEGNKT